MLLECLPLASPARCRPWGSSSFCGDSARYWVRSLRRWNAAEYSYRGLLHAFVGLSLLGASFNPIIVFISCSLVGIGCLNIGVLKAGLVKSYPIIVSDRPNF